MEVVGFELGSPGWELGWAELGRHGRHLPTHVFGIYRVKTSKSLYFVHNKKISICCCLPISDGSIPKISIPIRSRALNIDPGPIPSLGPSLWFDPGPIPGRSRSDPRSLPMPKLLYRFSCYGFILIILYCIEEFSLFLHSSSTIYPLGMVLGVLQFLNFCIR